MIDPLRHMEIFDPVAFGERRVDVIGAGATGSRIAMSLAKLGISCIHVWDFDSIEEHNIANQLYGNHQIGEFKVDALQAIIKQFTDTEIVIHNEKVTDQELGNIVFVLTDTMASRKEIWEKCIKYKLHVNRMIETRMGAEEMQIYTIDPCQPTQVEAWEGTLFEDEEIEETTACGASTTVGPTAELVSGFAVWQLIRWFALEEGAKDAKDDVTESEILAYVRPSTFVTRSFE